MVLMWSCGDMFKTSYFVLRRAPSQFWLCGSVQVMLDFAIMMQVFYYSTSHRRTSDCNFAGIHAASWWHVLEYDYRLSRRYRKFLIFKVVAVHHHALLKSGNFNFKWGLVVKMHHYDTFINISQTIAEILRVFIFKMATIHHLQFIKCISGPLTLSILVVFIGVQICLGSMQ